MSPAAVADLPLQPGRARASRATARAAAVAASAALLLAAAQALLRHEAVPRGDDRIYELMAQHPFATHTFPFAYRIAVPTVVHVLPFSHTTSFLLLAIVCAGAASGFLYALLSTLGADGRLAAALAILFAVSPVMLVAVLRDGRSADPATLLVMCAAACFIVRRQTVALAITLLIGACVRESAMFLIPFAYAVWAERAVDRAAAWRAVAAGLPAVVVYVGLRLGLPTTGREQVIGYAGGFAHERVHVVRAALVGWAGALRRVLLAFGPLWLVAPFALKDMRYARRGVVLLALCAVAATYALDWERVFVLMAPVVYPAAAFVVARRARLRAAVLAAWLALIVGYAAYMQHSGIAHVDSGSPPTYPVQ